MSDEQNQTAHHVWISDEEKIISFHQEDGYREKVLSTQEDFISFLFAHGKNSAQKRFYAADFMVTNQK